jgi:digeranylgeranylglycerophospholipid reductase
MIQYKTEVAVVGAGPAGSTAAEIIAEKGFEVALIERKREIGSPVQCGGFLPQVHELRSLLPRAKLPATLDDIPTRCIRHHTLFQRIYSPFGKSKEFHVDGRVVDRSSFDRYLAYRAAGAGATIMPDTRAEMGSSGLELTGHFSGNIEADVVIGADGPGSAVAHAAGIGERSVMGVCVEYEMADVTIDPNAAEMYFSTKYAPGGYAWIIPLGDDIANVGVGIQISHLAKGDKVRWVLDNFIENHPVAREKLRRGKVLAVMRGLVPAGGMPAKIQTGSVLLAGDAAGHVMATSGGGIPLAMVAGRVAGEVASGYLSEECQLEEYQSRIDYELGWELRNSVRIRGLMDHIMRSDKMMDALISILTPDQMKSIQRGQLPGAFSGIVAGLTK